MGSQPPLSTYRIVKRLQMYERQFLRNPLHTVHGVAAILLSSPSVFCAGPRIRGVAPNTSLMVSFMIAKSCMTVV